MVFYFLFYRFFRNKLGSEDQIKIKKKKNHNLMKIDGNTKSCFLRFLFNWKMVRMNFIFILQLKYISPGAVWG